MAHSKELLFLLLGYIDPGSGFTITTLTGWILSLLVGLFGFFLAYFKKIFKFLKKWKKPAIIILLIIAGIGLGLAARPLTMEKTVSSFNKKIIILGFDGLDSGIVESMMRKGELPHFSRLMDQGSYARLQTSNPSQSPVAWSVFQTSQNPGQNGIYDFIVRNPHNYRLDLSLADLSSGKAKRTLKSKTVWEYLAQARVPTIVLTCPVTFPPQKLYGRMLSGMGVPDILGTEGTFTFYTSEPLDAQKDIGGNVFHVPKSEIMALSLIGPKKSGKKNNNIKVPLKASLGTDKKSILLEYQEHSLELKTCHWSGWQEVIFRIGLFKEIKGIFKFYLVSLEPEFRLYISPIQWDPRQPFLPISYPAGYSKELAGHIGLYHTQGMPVDTWSVNEHRLGEEQLIEEAEEVFAEKKAMLDFELSHWTSGVLFCYFEESDTIQHMFWRYTDLLHPLYEKDAPKKYKDMIQMWYKKLDALLGEILQKTGKDDTLIVLSDHGFNTFRRAVHINAWLRKNGYLELKNPSAKEGVPLLEDIDWSKTKAYAIGFGSIYINQKGRERNGIVAPGAETEALKKELAGKLRDWMDEKYRKPVVYQVYKKEGIFKGKHSEAAPDIYLGFNTGYRASWQTALGACPQGLIEDNLKKWSGDHIFDPNLIPGILFINKQIKKKTIPTLYDITPTILKSAGFSDEKIKECRFEGENLL